MLALLLTPLAHGGVPVFVASTYNADLILVPQDRLEDRKDSACRRSRHRPVASVPLRAQYDTLERVTDPCGVTPHTDTVTAA